MNPRSTAAVKFNFASGQNNPAFRYHPRERSKRYGTDYLRIQIAAWRASYDHLRIGTALERVGRFNTTERAILAYLHAWDAVQYEGKYANAAALGKLVDRAPQNVNKTLRRLGRAHVIVNVGGDRAPSMRINGLVEEWKLDMLFHERFADTQRIAELHRRSVEEAQAAAAEADANDPNLSLELRKHRNAMAKGGTLSDIKFKDLFLRRSRERQAADRAARLAMIPDLVAAFASAAEKPFQGERNGIAWWCQSGDAELLGLLLYWDDESGMINELHKHPSAGRASAPAIADAITRTSPPIAPALRAKGLLGPEPWAEKREREAESYYTSAKYRRRQISGVQTQLAYLACRAVIVNQGERWRPDYRINWCLEEWDWAGLAQDALVHYQKPRVHTPQEKAWLASLEPPG